MNKGSTSVILVNSHWPEIAGIARSHLAAIESGKNSPTIETLWRIADALNVKPSMILKLVEEML